MNRALLRLGNFTPDRRAFSDFHVILQKFLFFRYEGTGRSLSLKLVKQLRHQSMTSESAKQVRRHCFIFNSTFIFKTL